MSHHKQMVPIHINGATTDAPCGDFSKHELLSHIGYEIKGWKLYAYNSDDEMYEVTDTDSVTVEYGRRFTIR